jgi:hypothetical protein
MLLCLSYCLTSFYRLLSFQEKGGLDLTKLSDHRDDPLITEEERRGLASEEFVNRVLEYLREGGHIFKALDQIIITNSLNFSI